MADCDTWTPGKSTGINPDFSVRFGTFKRKVVVKLRNFRGFSYCVCRLTGWTACGLRGRWKKRLFVKENIPCYRGCSEGFIPSIPLEPFNRSRMSCVGGSWFGFKEFECLSPTLDGDLSSNECQKIAERTPNVRCQPSDDDILCKLECPNGLVIPQKYKSRAEVRCSSYEAGHEWPRCEGW